MLRYAIIFSCIVCALILFFRWAMILQPEEKKYALRCLKYFAIAVSGAATIAIIIIALF